MEFTEARTGRYCCQIMKGATLRYLELVESDPNTSLSGPSAEFGYPTDYYGKLFPPRVISKFSNVLR